MIRYFRDDRSQRRALAWLAVFAAVGAALVLLYHDADQQDSGYHFLFARWAHSHPRYFIGVWARPLFTLLYFPFAQFGYAAAKFFTVIISLATAWQTFRLARQIGFDRAEMAIPLLFLQPSFFLLSSTVLTETLFALVFVIALRLHLSGRIKAGMVVASLLILVRPEGFFIGVLWGGWVLWIADCGLRIAGRPTFRERKWTDVGESWAQIPQSAIRNPQSAIVIACDRNGSVVACGLSDHARPALDRSRLAVRLAARRKGERDGACLVVRRLAALDRRPDSGRAFHRRAVAVVETPRIYVRRLGLSGSIHRAFIDVLARVVRLRRLRPILRLRIAGGRADRARRMERSGGAAREVLRRRAELFRRDRARGVVSDLHFLCGRLDIHARRASR